MQKIFLDESRLWNCVNSSHSSTVEVFRTCFVARPYTKLTGKGLKNFRSPSAVSYQALNVKPSLPNRVPSLNIATTQDSALSHIGMGTTQATISTIVSISLKFQKNKYRSMIHNYTIPCELDWACLGRVLLQARLLPRQPVPQASPNCHCHFRSHCHFHCRYWSCCWAAQSRGSI